MRKILVISIELTLFIQCLYNIVLLNNDTINETNYLLNQKFYFKKSLISIAIYKSLYLQFEPVNIPVV